MLENIIINANESMDGQDTVEVFLTAERKSVSIQISDRGRGISREHKNLVFNPFFTTKIKGQGIGLAVSRQFVEAAGGTLRFETREGGGTVFYIELPSAD